MARRHQGQYTARDYRFFYMLKRYLTGRLGPLPKLGNGQIEKRLNQKRLLTLSFDNENKIQIREIAGIFKYRKFQRILISVSQHFPTEKAVHLFIYVIIIRIDNFQ